MTTPSDKLDDTLNERLLAAARDMTLPPAVRELLGEAACTPFVQPEIGPSVSQMILDAGGDMEKVHARIAAAPATPRTDAAIETVMRSFTGLQWIQGEAVPVDFARQLERELAVANDQLNHQCGLLAKASVSAKPEFYCAAGGCVEQCVNCADEQPASIPQVRSTSGPTWQQQALAQLGYVRDSMHQHDVGVVQRFIQSAIQERKP